MTGSITFTDTEVTTNKWSKISGGSRFIKYWVCFQKAYQFMLKTSSYQMVLLIKETNYLSGQVIGDGVTVKESISLIQSKMKSNAQWDEENGEGLLQWVSDTLGRLPFRSGRLQVTLIERYTIVVL